MKKYVGAVLWKSFQLVIAAKIDEQPQNNVLAKIIHLFPATELIKKNKTIYKVLLIYIIFCMFSCFFVYIYKIYEYIFVYILFFLYMGKTVIHCQQSTQMHLPNDPRMEERPIINVYTVQIMFVCAL